MNAKLWSGILTGVGASAAVFAWLPYSWSHTVATGIGIFFAAYNAGYLNPNLQAKLPASINKP